MTDELLADAEVREIVIKGGKEHPLSLLDELRRDPHVGFVGPHIAAVNVSLSFAVAAGGGARCRRHGAGTGRGDPLLGAASPPERGELVLSASLARALDAATGASVIVVPSRKLEGRPRPSPSPSRSPPSCRPPPGSRAVPCSTPTTSAGAASMGRGLRDPASGPPRPPAARQPYRAHLRLYAADLDSVAPLVDFLTARCRPRRPHAADRQPQGLRADARVRFPGDRHGCRTGSALGGASLWGNVARKQRELGTLRLLGISRRHVVAFPLAQALAVAVAGWLAALLLYAAAAYRLNGGLGRGFGLGGEVCRLEPGHHAVAGAATLLTALLAASAAARRPRRSILPRHPPCDLSV